MWPSSSVGSLCLVHPGDLQKYLQSYQEKCLKVCWWFMFFGLVIFFVLFCSCYPPPPLNLPLPKWQITLMSSNKLKKQKSKWQSYIANLHIQNILMSISIIPHPIRCKILLLCTASIYLSRSGMHGQKTNLPLLCTAGNIAKFSASMH